MRKVFCFLLLGSFLLSACNSGNKEGKDAGRKDTTVTGMDTTNKAAYVKQNEADKAAIENMAPGMTRKEIKLEGADVNASIRQKWEKMDVYLDSTGLVRRIKLYPHPGISKRSEEYYYDASGLFFVYISDTGAETENNDEGKPGKEFHFHDGKLIEYDDSSGDEETVSKDEEGKSYEIRLLSESKEWLRVAQTSR